MTLALRHGPIFPHRKTNLPGGYMTALARSLGVRQAHREEMIKRAREARNPMDRAFYVASAKDWHRLCMQNVRLMRQEEQLQVSA